MGVLGGTSFFVLLLVSVRMPEQTRRLSAKEGIENTRMVLLCHTCYNRLYVSAAAVLEAHLVCHMAALDHPWCWQVLPTHRPAGQQVDGLVNSLAGMWQHLCIASGVAGPLHAAAQGIADNCSIRRGQAYGRSTHLKTR
jgi:hypothetical protein